MGGEAPQAERKPANRAICSNDLKSDLWQAIFDYSCPSLGRFLDASQPL
jgi:hypothetical protein